MLLLRRKVGERIVVAGEVVITVTEARDGSTRLGFEAPATVPIVREEAYAGELPPRPDWLPAPEKCTTEKCTA